MKIPFVDLAAQHRQLSVPIRSAMAAVMKRSDFILGQEVSLFEKEFAHYGKARYGVGVSSGTDALFLALASLGVGPGDEVIVPDFTYIATALAVSYTGARPVFVDVDPQTYTLDVGKLAPAITARTKAIIPVHLYGQPAAMKEILAIAQARGLKVIEDAAQAHGAHVATLPVGTLGDVGCFSFYPSKNLGCLGDGGMIVTNDEAIYKRVLMLRDYGRVSKYEHHLIGYNARLDTLQAAVLRVKLKKLNVWNTMRRRHAETYTRLLAKSREVITPRVASGRDHVYHVYAIRAKRRDALVSFLQGKGIGCVIHYPIPLHLQKAYSSLGCRLGEFPVSESLAQEVLSLPMFPHLTMSQMRYVVDMINAFYSSAHSAESHNPAQRAG